MAFVYDVETISGLIELFVNFIGNLVYSLTGYTGDLVGIAVLGAIVLALGGVMTIVGSFLYMKWLKR